MTQRSIWHRHALLATFAAICTGCGAPTRHAVEGTVTLDGQPLNEARILFIPQKPGLKKTGSVLRDGRYRLLADVGLVAGIYQVQVVDDPPDNDPDSQSSEPSTRRQLPEVYAAATPLRLEVDERGRGNFDFELKSSP